MEEKKVKSKIRLECEQFCKDVGLTMTLLSKKKKKFFRDDEEPRNVWTIELKRGRKKWQLLFGDSLINTERKDKPDIYDVISTLNKFKPKTYKMWCKEHAFDYKDENVKKDYEAVWSEYEKCKDFFGEENLKKLQKII